VLRAAETQRQRGSSHERERVHCEDDAEFQRGEAVVFLYDKGRGGDVGEEDALSESQLQDVQGKAFVAQDGSEIPERAQQALARPAVRGERFAEQHRTSEQENAERQQDAEDAAPADGLREHSAEYG